MPKPSGKSPERKLQVVLAVLRGEDEMRSDVGDLVKYWPILSVGVQFGFGEGRRRGGRW